MATPQKCVCECVCGMSLCVSLCVHECVSVYVWYELTVKGLVCVCRKWEAVTRTTKTGDGTDGRENSSVPRHIKAHPRVL